MRKSKFSETQIVGILIAEQIWSPDTPRRKVDA